MPLLRGGPGRLADAVVGRVVRRVGACQPSLDTCLAGVQAIALEMISLHIDIDAIAGRDGSVRLGMAGKREELAHRVKSSPFAPRGGPERYGNQREPQPRHRSEVIGMVY